MPPELEGELGPISLTGLLQLLQAESVSGRLTLGEHGVVDLARGVPVAATFREHTGETAFLELFLEPGGRFRFHAGTPKEFPPIGDVLSLVMEGCRLADDWARTHAHAVRLDPGTRLDGPAAVAEADLRAGRSVAAAAHRSGVARVDLADAVLARVEAGEATLVSAAAAPLDLDYHAALDLGRQSFHEGRVEEAVRAFERALDLRPGDKVALQNLHLAQRHGVASPPRRT